MQRSHSVDIQILRKYVDRIFGFIEHDLKFDRIAIDRDFYWSISDDELSDVAKLPAEAVVGSLRDDWEFVLNAFPNEEQAIPVMLIHVAPLLQWLANAVPSFRASDAEE